MNMQIKCKLNFYALQLRDRWLLRWAGMTSCTVLAVELKEPLTKDTLLSYPWAEIS